MSAVKRMEKAYSCLENYRSNCNSKEHKKFVDIFFPMLYQENKHRLNISVGRKISESKFKCALSMFTDNFIVVLDCWNDEPILVIKYTQNGYPATLINLTAVKNLQIETKEDKDINISFNYNDDYDYRLHMVIEN